MYLSKIEIHGFKSFGDAIKLDIPKGITAVIGPNGSGKSNVADAIRWVLGEQSAKTLRGSKMEDIIFSGTEKRKSLGYAEVSMHIMDPENQLPIEFNEVVIKRRVYRSGESEYFINGSTCRLKDIQELFMDTGVGKEGYSIIGQGQIDKVLSYKPDDRRGLFEEATGIYKYKSRRMEAEKKLEKQRENLVRVQDIIDEISLRIGPLEVEAQKAKNYNILMGQLKELEINIFIQEAERIEKDEAKISKNIEELDSELEKIKNEKVQLEENYQKWKEDKEKIYHDIEEISGLIAQYEKEEQNVCTEVKVTREKITSLENLLKQIEEEKDQQILSKENMIQELSLLRTKLTALKIEEASKKDQLKKEESKFNQLSEELESLESSLNASKFDKYNKLRDIDLLKAEIQKTESLETELEYRYNQITENINLLNSDILHQETNKKLLGKNIQEISDKSKSLEQAFNQIDKEKIELELSKDKKEKDLALNKQHLSEYERKLKWLEQIKEDHEGYYASVKQVLNLVKEDPITWKGIKGVVGELLSVDKKYELAIVTALGGAIQNIVTEEEKDAKKMISLMKQRGIGKVTFLPRDTVQAPNKIKDYEELKKETGFLGIASDLVHYDAAYAHIFASLLGRIIIAETMEQASKLAAKYHYRYKIVTLEGEVFNVGGSLTGGSTKNQSNNIFSRNREMEGLKADIQKSREQIASLEEEINSLNQKFALTNEKWDQINEEIAKLETEKREKFLESDKIDNQLKLTKNSQIMLIKEQNELEEKISLLQKSRLISEQNLANIENTADNDEETITETENKILALKKEKDALLDELTEKKVSLSHSVQSMGYTEEKIKELEQAIIESDQKSYRISENTDSLIKDRQTLLDKIVLLNKEIEALEEKVIEQKSKKEALNIIKENMQAEEEEIMNKNKQVFEKLDIMKQERYRLQSKLESIHLQKENCYKEIWEKYELTYHRALNYKKELGSLTQMNDSVRNVKAKIKEIGNVNVNAAEEFEEVTKRYEYLTKQKEDIEKAEQALLEMIDDLMIKMESIFKKQFKNIADNFSQVFKELFGGGEAYLKLTDETNVLECGIEIFAKPPGKKFQILTLLSGGERTFTAIALLFAILKLKPSPFCILDEIESALDDANVIRFASYLDKLADETQFIVITHRKGTMERAHTLYGVTMQERGVSTVLSVQLQDASKYLENNSSDRRQVSGHI